MQTAFGYIVIGGFVALFARWVYVHWRFWSVVREEKPELYRELSGEAFAYARGRGWINYALDGKHRGTGIDRLEKAGDALASAYGSFQVSLAVLWLLGSFFVGFFWLFA